jgi:hexosaminidase
VIDLQQEIPISKAWVRTYVEIGEEILDLRELSVSNDGKEYKEVKSEVYPAVSKEDKNGIYTHELSFDTVQARYVKITARPEYNIPAWHWGKGRPAFIFVDEIGLE